MYLSDGHPKGIKLVLEERGLWKKGLKRICSECKIHLPTKNNCCAVRILFFQLDFAAQRPLIQEIIEDQGHKIIFYPKFHCELNFIEQFWNAAKQFTRNNCDYTFKGLEKMVPDATNTNLKIC
ncbi:uncharacterized protein OCT59_004152 [Rhizophagus irregularis]|uniref:uncharacterized protein n=1 Tax=Rhizophagus irregularis TaxID=588596 RepID=UPI000CB99C39|nr:hypothetical protein OCT59_004152 [Rhizophagus irregularis]GBC53648.1 hypothetical protein TRAVEDRAFT_22553 [Rhizophagus irregularis DAOM 181602=DAOM 197198]